MKKYIIALALVLLSTVSAWAQNASRWGLFIGPATAISYERRLTNQITLEATAGFSWAAGYSYNNVSGGRFRFSGFIPYVEASPRFFFFSRSEEAFYHEGPFVGLTGSAVLYGLKILGPVHKDPSPNASLTLKPHAGWNIGLGRSLFLSLSVGFPYTWGHYSRVGADDVWLNPSDHRKEISIDFGFGIRF